MSKKFYISPDAEVEKFSISYEIMTTSADEALEDNGGEFTGDGNWEF